MKLPRIIGDTWLNSRPLTSAELVGKAVLVDFWSYSRVQSRLSLPYLRSWWEKYRNIGLVMIGIHTPEFSFEKELANVEEAVSELGVTWPVVLDNEYINWHNFDNQSWEAKFLADHKGNIIFIHTGENNYAETERVIQGLICTVHPANSLPKIENDHHEHNKSCLKATPELYCGYAKGAIINQEGYKKNNSYNYLAPKKIPEDCLALSGQWSATEEYVESSDPGASLELNFHGTEVNLVLSPSSGVSKATVLYNNQKVPERLRGKDVDENSELEIKKANLYNLIKANVRKRGILTITGKIGNFRAYAFTFSGCMS